MWIFHEPGPKVTGEKVRPRLRAVGESRRPHTGPPSCYSTNRDRITIYIGVHLRQHSATQQIILQRISDIYMFIYHIYIHCTWESRHSQALTRSVSSLYRRIKRIPAECHVLHFRITQKTRRNSSAVFAGGVAALTLPYRGTSLILRYYTIFVILRHPAHV